MKRESQWFSSACGISGTEASGNPAVSRRQIGGGALAPPGASGKEQRFRPIGAGVARGSSIARAFVRDGFERTQWSMQK
jgi:hypothetical protein